MSVLPFFDGLPASFVFPLTATAAEADVRP
jgi:hypothetical protein